VNEAQLAVTGELASELSTRRIDTRILDLTPGLHRGVHGAVYHERIRAMVSSGGLKRLGQSPAHYDAWVRGEIKTESTPALEFGTAFHMAVLEPGRFESTYALEPEFGDCRTKGPRAARDAWRAENAGRTPIDADDARAISGMLASIRRHPLAARMFQNGEAELTVRWTDDVTGLPCRARPDFYSSSLAMVVDVKTTDDASPQGFTRSIAKYGYAKQEALYRAGLAAVGKPVSHFVFLSVEKTAPFNVGAYVIAERDRFAAHQWVRDKIDLLASCIATDTWPGYDPHIVELSLPSWAI
jgi:hypothetical protein